MDKSETRQDGIGQPDKKSWVTGDEAQGIVGRRKMSGARFLPPAFLCAQIFIERETSEYEVALGRSVASAPVLMFAYKPPSSKACYLHQKIPQQKHSGQGVDHRVQLQGRTIGSCFPLSFFQFLSTKRHSFSTSLG